MGRQLLLSVVLASLTLTGCSSARQVSKDSESGVIAIPSSSSSKHREKAQELMTAHFPEGYEIVKEEEVVIGKTTNWEKKEGRGFTHEGDGFQVEFSAGGRGNTRGESTTIDKTEYRLYYRKATKKTDTTTLASALSAAE